LHKQLLEHLAIYENGSPKNSVFDCPKSFFGREI
jgi:hypothetical protein